MVEAVIAYNKKLKNEHLSERLDGRRTTQNPWKLYAIINDSIMMVFFVAKSTLAKLKLH